MDPPYQICVVGQQWKFPLKKRTSLIWGSYDRDTFISNFDKDVSGACPGLKLLGISNRIWMVQKITSQKHMSPDTVLTGEMERSGLFCIVNIE